MLNEQLLNKMPKRFGCCVTNVPKRFGLYVINVPKRFGCCVYVPKRFGCCATNVSKRFGWCVTNVPKRFGCWIINVCLQYLLHHITIDNITESSHNFPLSLHMYAASRRDPSVLTHISTSLPPQQQADRLVKTGSNFSRCFRKTAALLSIVVVSICAIDCVVGSHIIPVASCNAKLLPWQFQTILSFKS